MAHAPSSAALSGLLATLAAPAGSTLSAATAGWWPVWKVPTNCVDCIVSDVHMSDCCGVNLVRRARARATPHACC